VLQILAMTSKALAQSVNAAHKNHSLHGPNRAGYSGDNMIWWAWLLIIYGCVILGAVGCASILYAMFCGYDR